MIPIKKYFLVLFIALSIPSFPLFSNAQINGTTQPVTPPSSGTGVGQNSGPYNNSSTGGAVSGSMSADADDPGGPTGNVDDNVPLDGGVCLLLALGLVHGYIIMKHKKKNIQSRQRIVS